MKHRLLALVLCLSMLLSVAPCAFAAEEATAADITADTSFTGTGYDSFSFLSDKKIKTYKKSSGDAKITLENEKGMGSLYLLFNLEYGSYTITNNDTQQTITAGEYGFLHEYVDLEAGFGAAPTSVTLDFARGTVRLSEIYVFNTGAAPDFVQQWDTPLDGGADIVLFATHGDDDHLFFAGLLPLYAGEKNLRVQVVYLTDHRNLTYARTHEMLNGLWAVGVRAYPVFGSFSDFLIESLSGTYAEYKAQGVSKDELLEFVVEQVRRFRPQVAIGHDIKGEYGHGMHMVYTDLLIQALDVSNDPTVYPELAEKYGVWDIPKTYLHLYEENKIEMDHDQPLESFDGMTAFEVSQKLGYPCHESQQYTWFTRWINGKNTKITKATQIETYNPCKYGLYRTTVGEDVQKNDFMENITPYEELERIEEERRQEELRQQEEQRRQEEEDRKKQEAEEQARQEAEKLAQEQQQRQEAVVDTVGGALKAVALFGLLAALVFVLILVVMRIRSVQRHRKRMRRSRRSSSASQKNL